MALAITRMAPAGYDWKSDCQASRSRNVRVFKRHLEKRVNRYVQKGECDEPVEGKLKHFTKQYEKMHWVAAVTPQDYVDRLTNNFPVLVLEARKGLHVPRKAPLARVTCKDCGGSGLCEHGRLRNTCKDCGGGSICEHGRRRSTCKDFIMRSQSGEPVSGEQYN